MALFGLAIAASYYLSLSQSSATIWPHRHMNMAIR